MIPLELNRIESLEFSMADGKARQVDQEGVMSSECFQTSFPGRDVADSPAGSAVVTLTVGREWKTASWVAGAATERAHWAEQGAVLSDSAQKAER